MKKRRLLRVLILIVILALLPLPSVAQENASDNIIRIGYFDIENYMEGQNGEPLSGYTYGLLNEMEPYIGLEYEYVYGSFSDLYEMLKKGEIDLLPNVLKSPERENEILFGSFVLSGERYYISAVSTKEYDDLSDLSVLNGKRLVTVEGAYQNVIFADWAEKNNISVEYVYTPLFEKLWDIARSGDADYILNIDTSTPEKGFKTLLEIGYAETFFGISPKRPELVGMLDDALNKLNQVSPTMLSDLNSKYLMAPLSTYRMDQNNYAWLNQHPVIRIGGLSDNLPYTYQADDGTVQGVFVDVFQLILDRLDLTNTAEWILYPTIEDARNALKSHDVDVLCPEYHSYYDATKNGLYLSEILTNNAMSMLTLPSATLGSNMTIASSGVNLTGSFIAEHYPDSEVIPKESLKDCISTVLNGTAACTIADTYMLQEALRSYSNASNIKLVPLSAKCEVCFATGREDHSLIEVINRGLHLISDADVGALKIQYILNINSSESFLDLVRNNLIYFIISALLLLAMLILLIFQSHTSRKLTQSLNETRKLKESLTNYKNAIQSESIISLETNLTTGTLNYGQWKDNEGKNVSLHDILGLDTPCSYDEYIRKWKETFVIAGSDKVFEASTDREHLIDYFEAGKAEISFDYSAVSITGEKQYLRRNIYMIRNTEGDVIAYTTVKDISNVGLTKEKEEQYKAELENAKDAAEQASKAKTTFLFNMSHDIRTPMNAILGFTRMAKKHIDDKEEATISLNKIEVAGEQLLDLINDVLEMSRIEAGRIEIIEAPSDIARALDGIDPLIETLATSKSIEYTSKIEQFDNHYVWIDRSHLNRVLINLINNAVKYTMEGGRVHVEIRETGTAQNGIAQIQFIVTDTGIGMSEEFCQHLFDEFAREQSITVSKQQGTGLGLAITKRIVDAMNGTINVTSKKGVGTTFVVTIPARVMIEEEIAEYQKTLPAFNDQPGHYELNGKKVLLVEDNALNREIATDILSEEEIEVDIAEDGLIAVNKIREKGIQYYDFVLMDIQMPVMDGYEATRQIRAMQKEDESLVIIAVSANAFEDDKKHSLEAGMNSHIAKPVDVKELKDALNSFSRKR